MELTTTLHGLSVQTVVRTIGINPNHWYPGVWAWRLRPAQVEPVTAWKQAIAAIGVTSLVFCREQLASFGGLSDRAAAATILPGLIQPLYSHYKSASQGTSSVYWMRLLENVAQRHSATRVFFLMNWPQPLQQTVRPSLNGFIRRFMLRRFLKQDDNIGEREQENYLEDPGKRYVEVSPAILTLQRSMVRQYEQFMQQSSQLSDSPIYQADQASRPDALV